MAPKNLEGIIKNNLMGRVFFLSAFLISSMAIQAQKLTGLWYSGDSTRVYEIKQTADNKFMAVIKSTERKADSVGYIVIKDLQYNARKKSYKGIIYAVSDNQSTVVKIKFDKHDEGKIILKLSRMFIMNVSIYWVKAAAEKALKPNS